MALKMNTPIKNRKFLPLVFLNLCENYSARKRTKDFTGAWYCLELPEGYSSSIGLLNKSICPRADKCGILRGTTTAN
jgi:hypothetical protein